MGNEFSVESAMKATSAEALIVLARENGVILSAEDAADLYSDLHMKIGALSDDALDFVYGGSEASLKACPNCHSTNISIIFNEGLKYQCGNISCSYEWRPATQS